MTPVQTASPTSVRVTGAVRTPAVSQQRSHSVVYISSYPGSTAVWPKQVTLSAEDWDAFMRALDRPARVLPRLKRLVEGADAE